MSYKVQGYRVEGRHFSDLQDAAMFARCLAEDQNRPIAIDERRSYSIAIDFVNPPGEREKDAAG